MKKAKLHRTTALIFALLFASGFQISTTSRWNVDKDYPTIWIKFDQDILTSTFSDTNIEREPDLLEGVASADQMLTVLRAVLDEYTNINTSYLRLQFFPITGFDFGTTPTEDTSFVESETGNRIIEVKLQAPSTAIGASGEAYYKTEGGKITTCAISLTKSTVSNAQGFKGTLIHELGHCLGLGHAHNDKQAIMSYNSSFSQSNLGVDDIMGITFLYPSDKSYAKETPTLGLSCQRLK